jgi:hypothetical protein
VTGSVLELTAELLKVDAMFGGFSAADVDDRDVAAEALGESRVVFDVDFAEGGVEFAEQRGDGGFGFLAEVAAGFGVDGDFGAGIGRGGFFWGGHWDGGRHPILS